MHKNAPKKMHGLQILGAFFLHLFFYSTANLFTHLFRTHDVSKTVCQVF